MDIYYLLLLQIVGGAPLPNRCIYCMPFLALDVRKRYDQPGSSGSSSGSMTVGSLNGKSD